MTRGPCQKWLPSSTQSRWVKEIGQGSNVGSLPDSSAGNLFDAWEVNGTRFQLKTGDLDGKGLSSLVRAHAKRLSVLTAATTASPVPSPPRRSHLTPHLSRNVSTGSARMAARVGIQHAAAATRAKSAAAAA